MANSRPLVVVSLDSQSVFLLLKSPPAKKHGPRVWKNHSKCSAFKLCRGGQYTEAIVISRSDSLTRTDVALITGSAYFNCS